MHMEVRALFGQFVWRRLTSMTSQSILPEDQSHTEGVTTGLHMLQ